MPSDVSLRKLIARHRDFPIIRHGGQGKAYVIDLDAAEAFVRKLRDKPKLDREAKQRWIREFGLTAIAGKHDAE